MADETTIDPPVKRKRGRPRKVVVAVPGKRTPESYRRKDPSETVKQIWLKLIEFGDSTLRASKIVGIPQTSWPWILKRDPELNAKYLVAVERRAGLLALAGRKTILDQVKKGHPFFYKALCWNYKGAGLLDPDHEARKKEFELKNLELRLQVLEAQIKPQAPVIIPPEIAVETEEETTGENNADGN